MKSLIRCLRALGTVAIVITLTVWTPTLDRPHAEPLSSSPAPALRTALGQLSTLPARDILSPAALRVLAQRARRAYWDIPEDPSWPTDASGQPRVTTERVDVLHHTVEGSQSAKRIRTMYRISRSKLQRLNPDVDLRDLDPGQTLVVWRRDPNATPVSYGASHGGRLYRGEPLPDSENFELLFQHRAFGTHYTVSEITRAMTTYYDRYPDADKLIIGDLSFRTGGRIYPHKSHRSGRDVDVSFPRTDEIPDYRSFHWMSARDMDVDKTFFLLKTFIDGGYIQYIFINHSHQRRLYRAAKRRGAPQAWLDRVFEYPDWGGRALIRHEPGHDDHMHIRFHCQPTDRRCQ